MSPGARILTCPMFLRIKQTDQILEPATFGVERQPWEMHPGQSEKEVRLRWPVLTHKPTSTTSYKSRVNRSHLHNNIKLANPSPPALSGGGDTTSILISCSLAYLVQEAKSSLLQHLLKLPYHRTSSSRVRLSATSPHPALNAPHFLPVTYR